MESKVCYISTKQQLIDEVDTLLGEYRNPDIMISGIWTKSLHEAVINLIIERKCSSACRVIIPKLLFKGNISLTLMRSLCKADGQVRVNNSITNNLLIIGEYVFILSFSSRLNNINMLSTNFECAVMTNDEDIVGKLKEQLENIFDNSILFRM